MKRIAMATVAIAGLATPVLAQPQSPVIDPAWFVGVWSDKQDCSVTASFQPGGRYVTAAGEARWAIERGNVLVLSNGERRQEVPIERVNDRQIRMISNNVISYRCPASAAPRPAASNRPAPPPGIPRQ